MSLAALASALKADLAEAEAKLAADAKAELQNLETPSGRAAAGTFLTNVLTKAQPYAASLSPEAGSLITQAISAIPTVEKVADVAGAVIGS